MIINFFSFGVKIVQIFKALQFTVRVREGWSDNESKSSAIAAVAGAGARADVHQLTLLSRTFQRGW